MLIQPKAATEMQNNRFKKFFVQIFFVFTTAIGVGISNQATAAIDTDIALEIKSILIKQAEHWNNQDLVGFMEAYWNSKQLTFSGGGKTTRGWQATLNRYKEKYPPEKMGRLTFDHLETTELGDSAALVLGQWHLKSEKSNADGNFSLVLRKMNDQWKIIHDHSSSNKEK